MRQLKHTVWLVKLRTSPRDTCLKNAGSIRSWCIRTTDCSLGTPSVFPALNLAVISASQKYVLFRKLCTTLSNEKDEQ
jgi:hypothetical protein